jgi:hypothetical protein
MKASSPERRLREIHEAARKRLRISRGHLRTPYLGALALLGYGTVLWTGEAEVSTAAPRDCGSIVWSSEGVGGAGEGMVEAQSSDVSGATIKPLNELDKSN